MEPPCFLGGAWAAGGNDDDGWAVNSFFGCAIFPVLRALPIS